MRYVTDKTDQPVQVHKMRECCPRVLVCYALCYLALKSGKTSDDDDDDELITLVTCAIVTDR